MNVCKGHHSVPLATGDNSFRNMLQRQSLTHSLLKVSRLG